MNNQKKNNTGLIVVLIIVGIVGVLSIIGFLVFIAAILGLSFFAVNTIINDTVVTLGEFDDNYSAYNERMYTSYDRFKLDFKDVDALTREDFDKNNYYVFTLDYDSCSEEDVRINNVSQNYSNGKLEAEVGFTYKSKCGLCAPQVLVYALKVNKNVKDVDLDVTYKSTNKHPDCGNVAYKPMIYLYPEEDTYVNVRVGYPDLLTVSYPKYERGWDVLAKKDGTLSDGVREYYGLYWEGLDHKVEVKEEGFVVKGEDTIKFLEEKLEVLGLNEREANEFIIYWLPKMEHNTYNYIRFETKEEIDEYMPLTVTPKPDTVIRVYMNFKSLDEKINVKEQRLTKVNREGFTVVEWGGSFIN